MKKEQDEEHRTKRILLNKYKDNFEQRKQEQRARTHYTRTNNKKTNQPDVAYLVLDKCPNNHCLSTQLDKLKNIVVDTKWPDVIRSISMLVHIGRSVYSQVARSHINIIQQIYNISKNDCAKYLDLQVDRDNTTLFLDIEWQNRVGIYVNFTDDI